MRIEGREYRTIWPDVDGRRVHVIDQTALPHLFRTRILRDRDAAALAIREMIVRGAPLIGVTAAYGLALAAARRSERRRARDGARQAAARPGRRRSICAGRWIACARVCARAAAGARARGLRRGRRDRRRGRGAPAQPSATTALALIASVAARKPGRPVNVLTHCNAGWLATVDWGTALAPIYTAHDAGIARPCLGRRNAAAQPGRQPDRLGTGQHGVPHTVIADNAGGHLMQHGQVDLVHRRHRPHDARRRRLQQDRHLPEGAGRARQRRALLRRAAALDDRLDASRDGVAEIPIEERAAREVTHIAGPAADGAIVEVRLTPEGTPAAQSRPST